MSIIEFIRDRARYYNCPVCGRDLRGCEVRILDHEEERFTVHMTCAACRVKLVVVLAIQSAAGDAAPEEDDELVIEDVIASHPLQPPPPIAPIAADEVLEVHMLLRDFKGSFDELLKTPHR